MKKRNERLMYLAVLLIACAITFAAAYYLYHKQATSVSPLKTVYLNTMKIKSEDVTVIQKYIGHVEAIHHVYIVPYINGYLQNIAVNPGQMVNKNDLLLTIDPSEYKAKLDEAEALVLQKQALLDYNQNYYSRIQKSGQKTFSQIDIDNAKNNFLQAQASLKNAEAARDYALVNYNHSQIKAPISGLTGNFNLTTGDYVSPNGSPLLDIVQMDPIRVVFSLTDSEYLDLQNDFPLFKNTVIKLLLSNGETYSHSGTFKYIDNKINKATNSLAVYVYFQNDKNILLPESFVTVEVSKNFKDSVLLDKNLIKFKDSGYFLTITRGGKLLDIPVHILAEKENKYVIENIFSSDDLLVLDNVDSYKASKNIQFKISKS